MLPSFSGGSNPPSAAGLQRMCEEIESLGFDSIWAVDHFLPSPAYGQSWLSPLLTLAFAAAHTRRLRIGTAVAVLPLRSPVLLAKDVATLQLLSGNRFILGVGAGWNPLEFEALQVPRQERGPRTDESLEALRLLLGGGVSAFEGARVRFPEISIEPPPEVPVEIWVGGGSQPQVAGSTESKARAPDSVIRRIAGADGWISPSTAPPRLIAADWARIGAAARQAGRDPRSIVFAHMNSFHLVRAGDRERAWREQEQVFGRYLGPRRPWEFAKSAYLVGTLDDVLTSLRERLELGVTYFVLGPVTAEPSELSRQLRLLATEVLPAFA